MTKKTNKFQELYEATFKSNISDEIKSKNKFDYLSWAYATKHLKVNYPEAKVVVAKYPDANGNEILPYLASNLGYFVTVRLYLNNQDFKDGIFEEFTHPVFDYRNQAIKNPTSMNINNSIQRATAKVIAIATGIGLSLYANEDIPNEDNAPSERKPKGKFNQAPKLQSQPQYAEPNFLNNGINISEPKPTVATVTQKVKLEDHIIDAAINHLTGSGSLNQLEMRNQKSVEKYPDLKKVDRYTKAFKDTRTKLEAVGAGL